MSHFKEVGKLSSLNAKKLGPRVEREGHVVFFFQRSIVVFFQSS